MRIMKCVRSNKCNITQLLSAAATLSHNWMWWLTGIELCVFSNYFRLKRLKCHINSTYSGRFTQSLQKSCRCGQSPNYKCQPIVVFKQDIFTQHILNFLFYSYPTQYYHINKQCQWLKGMWSFSGYSFMM